MLTDEKLAELFPEGEDRAAAENRERLEKLREQAERKPAKPEKENGR